MSLKVVNMMLKGICMNTWLFTFVNKFILFLYKVHKLLMILCILAVVHVTVHHTCMDSCV